jgi:DNA repair protein SbcC/Rad50
MRPSRLALENFGPYRERAEVDFSLLEPLFLVCGKTGSGKTSIFDAMTYALYGEAPGTRGGLERQLWSQHAKPGDVPLVEFEFFLGGAEYRAVRSPPYRRSSKRGKEALIEVDASAAFYRREGEPPEWKLVADKKTEVDEAIQELIGLNEDEFSKIILLPQGEFQRFLEMKSSDRVEVLEKLFPVGMHEAVSAIAKEKSKEALAAVRRVDAELERLGGAAETEAAQEALRKLEAESSRLEAERNRAIERLQAAELALSRLREAVERAARAGSAKERLALLEAASPAAEAREKKIAAARAAARVAPALSAREAVETDLDAARASSVEQRSRLALLGARSSEIESFRAEVLRRAEEATAIDRELGELRAAQEAWQEALRARVEFETARKRAEDGERRTEAARKAEAAALAARDAAAVSAEEESRIRSAFETDRTAAESAAASLKAAESAATLAEKISRIRAAAESAQAEANAAAHRLAGAGAALAPLEAADRSALAARLAVDLAPGEACPVCGARDHPAPAHAPAGAPSAAELERARAARETALAGEAEARAAAASIAQRVAEAERELADLRPGGSLDAEDVVLAASEAKDEAKRAAEAVAVSAKNLREMDERRKEVSKLEADLEEARGRRASEEAEAQAAALEAAKLGARLEAAVTRAGSDDPAPKVADAEARRELAASERGRLEGLVAAWEADRQRTEALAAELASRVDALVERLNAATGDEASALAEAGFGEASTARSAQLGAAALAALEAEAAAYKSELDAARATALALEAEIAASARKGAEGEADEGSLATEVAAARDSRDELQAALDAAVASASEFAREQGARARLVSERARLGAEWSRLGGLSALLCGEMPGRKLPFKNYVLGAYFRVVVERASARLSLMSDGRYALAADEGGGRGYLGLEILVRDAHTGQSRPAGTLSGGERFMAALSLAFGLADTIRERSGGASLDAIFIDEGFGSLDDEALDRAITVLDEARGARMVGIVSHVAELKARLPSRIEVTKGRSGSSLRIVS